MYVQGVFLLCQTFRKFWHLELFDGVYYVIWQLQLVIFWGRTSKKTPCILFMISFILNAFVFVHIAKLDFRCTTRAGRGIYVVHLI